MIPFYLVIYNVIRYGLCHGTAGNAYAFFAFARHLDGQDRLRARLRGLRFAQWCCDYEKHGCPLVLSRSVNMRMVRNNQYRLDLRFSRTSLFA